MDIYHGLRLRCTVTGPVDAVKLGAWLADRECQDLACRVIAGHRIETSNGNRIGKLSEDAEQAWDRLADLLETGDVARLDDGGYADAGDLYSPSSTEEATGLSDAALITLDAKQLDDLAEHMESDARDNGYVVDGIRNWLDTRVQEIRDAQS
jgi:hypothetical protein